MSNNIVGRFGRAWNGSRPADNDEYVYGFCELVRREPMAPYKIAMGDRYFDYFEPAESEPVFTDPPRRLIKDRAKLARVLLDGGWVPDTDGSFVHPSRHNFVPRMWRYCGEILRLTSRNRYVVDAYNAAWAIEPEWTEPDDE